MHQNIKDLQWLTYCAMRLLFIQVDAGTHENVALHSRDEKSVLVVSYADLKTCLEKTFAEVLSSSGESRTSETHAEVGRGSNRQVANGHSIGVFKYGSSS